MSLRKFRFNRILNGFNHRVSELATVKVVFNRMEGVFLSHISCSGCVGLIESRKCGRNQFIIGKYLLSITSLLLPSVLQVSIDFYSVCNTFLCMPQHTRLPYIWPMFWDLWESHFATNNTRKLGGMTYWDLRMRSCITWIFHDPRFFLRLELRIGSQTFI